MRTFVIGDIHGWAGSLEQLLTLLRPRAAGGDSLVFLGDYVDRGPASRQVVEQVLAEREQWPGPVVTLKGNHEAMMLEALATWRDSPIAPYEWLRGADGAATVLSYCESITMPAFEAALPAAHREFFETLALFHEDENGIYVHAGLEPGRAAADCGEETLLWIRDEFIDSDCDWGRPVVFGHTPQYELRVVGYLPSRRRRGPAEPLRERAWGPLDRPEKIGLDTGRGWGGPLTAVILPEREFVSVSA